MWVQCLNVQSVTLNMFMKTVVYLFVLNGFDSYIISIYYPHRAIVKSIRCTDGSPVSPMVYIFNTIKWRVDVGSNCGVISIFGKYILCCYLHTIGYFPRSASGQIIFQYLYFFTTQFCFWMCKRIGRQWHFTTQYFVQCII